MKHYSYIRNHTKSISQACDCHKFHKVIGKKSEIVLDSKVLSLVSIQLCCANAFFLKTKHLRTAGQLAHKGFNNPKWPNILWDYTLWVFKTIILSTLWFFSTYSTLLKTFPTDSWVVNGQFSFNHQANKSGFLNNPSFILCWAYYFSWEIVVQVNIALCSKTLSTLFFLVPWLFRFFKIISMFCRSHYFSEMSILKWGKWQKNTCNNELLLIF